MSYMTDRADLLVRQLEKFSHESRMAVLVGQRVNLEYWLHESEECLKIIDDYPQRFWKMAKAQKEYIDIHKPLDHSPCAICGGPCEFGPSRLQPPSKIPAEELDEARCKIRNSVRRFVIRLYSKGLLDKIEAKISCDRVGTGIEETEFDSDRKL